MINGMVIETGSSVMKSICGIILLIPLVVSAQCTTQIITIDGQTYNCIVCPNYTTCN